MVVSQYENIRVVLAEPNAQLREEMKSSLRAYGFSNIQATGNIAPIVKAVEAGEVDLLIGDTSLPEGDITELVHDIRHNQLGDNPFIVIVTLISHPTADLVRGVIDSGPDQVLVKPIDSAALFESVLTLTHKRKRFVVTTDYVGPDRRSGKRTDEGKMEVPLIEIPNPMRHRMTGQMSESVMRRSINAAIAEINEQKVQRHIFQVNYLLERIVPAIENRQFGPDLLANLKKLVMVVGDLNVRIRSSKFSHAASMCMTLFGLVKKLAKNELPVKDRGMLLQLGQLIQRTMDSGALSEEGAGVAKAADVSVQGDDAGKASSAVSAD